MVFADILTFITPGVMAGIMTGYADSVKITQELLLVFALLTEIPMLMIYLSRKLEYKNNRILNIIAGIITILWVVGGGSPHLHYIFFCSVEVICILLIIISAWKWKKPVSKETTTK